jgi:hypothetical protein
MVNKRVYAWQIVHVTRKSQQFAMPLADTYGCLSSFLFASTNVVSESSFLLAHVGSIQMNDLFQYQFCGFLPQTLVKFNPSITRKWIATLRSDLDLCHQGVPPLRRANLAARVFSRMARLLRNLDLSLEHLEASRCV